MIKLFCSSRFLMVCGLWAYDNDNPGLTENGGNTIEISEETTSEVVTTEEEPEIEEKNRPIVAAIGIDEQERKVESILSALTYVHAGVI